MAAWIGGALVAGGIVGDLFGASGQKSANATNIALQKQDEEWQTQMSNTAVQRRAADMKAAGINPLMAAGNPASTPSLGPAQVQNPNAAFGQLGTQLASAVAAEQNTKATESQINLQASQAKQAEANADLTRSHIPQGEGDTVTGPVNHDLGNAELSAIQASNKLTDAQTKQVSQNLSLINSQVENTDANTALTNIKTLMAGQDYSIQQATKQAIIQQELTKGAAAKNIAAVQEGKLGPTIAYLQAISQGVNDARSAVHAATRW